MSTPQFDVTPFLRQDEGQHFDRKSLWEGREGARPYVIAAPYTIRLPSMWPPLPTPKVVC